MLCVWYMIKWKKNLKDIQGHKLRATKQSMYLQYPEVCKGLLYVLKGINKE